MAPQFNWLECRPVTAEVFARSSRVGVAMAFRWTSYKNIGSFQRRSESQTCAKSGKYLVGGVIRRRTSDRSCRFVKAIIASIACNDSMPRAILRIEGAKARPASASSNGNTVPCFHKRYGMGPELRCLSPLECYSRLAQTLKLLSARRSGPLASKCLVWTDTTLPVRRQEFRP